jgi:4-amino-4-deoxy-L-arabinose transferase-like glycosyltransferase
LLILIIAAALRFYRLPEMAYFDFDQSYAANFAYDVLREFPIRMIGQGLSIEGLFMGPLYFYYLVPFYALFNLHPLGGAVGSVFLGLGIITAYYFFGYKLFGKPAGLIAAFLGAVLFREIESDWSVTPAFSSKLLILVTWYCFYQYWQGKTKYLPLLGLVFGLYTSFHPVLFPFYLVFLILFLIKRKLPNLKILFLSIIAFIAPITPLILFEFFHNFLEVRRLFELIMGPKSPSTVLSITKLLKYTLLVLSEPQNALGINLYPPVLLSGLLLLIMVIFTLRRVSFWKESFHLLMLLITLLVFILYYFFLPVHLPEYYFMAPIILLFFYFSGLLGFWTTRPLGRIGVLVFLAFIALINIRTLDQSKWSNPNLITLVHKDTIVKAIIKEQPKEEKFFVSYLNLPGWNFGFSYFFKLYDYKPEDKGVENAIYTIVIPKALSIDSIDISSGNVGLILP